MASNFVIFEDQENFNEKKALDPSEIRRERTKLAPLTNKVGSNENGIEKQTLKTTKTNDGARAFKDKNVFQQTNDFKGKIKTLKEEQFIGDDSIINVTSNISWTSTSTSCLETSASFTYRKETQDDQLATPMSVAEAIGTPMSVDKTSLEDDQKSLAIKNDRERFFEVAEYQKDILKYLKVVENQKNIRPRADYINRQPDINDSMRMILIDWLVEVSEEYKLHSETLCLAVHYIDRFLSYMSVVRAKLQLVGTTAMFIASKYEEIYPPEIGEFVYITDDTYTKQQVLRMEKLLLKVLTFDLSAPSTLCYINLFGSMMNIPEKIKFMAQYLCELSLLRAVPFLNYTPSQTSSAAIALSYYNYGSSIWNKKMQNTFGYEFDELKEVIGHLNDIHLDAETLTQQAIQEKFKSSKYLQVSLVKPKKLSVEELDEISSKFNAGDELNTTAENIESVRQKTELLFN
ncbi:unnamed protein product [Chironomus riparius]|uniref:Uncharacterized protein n=1 Tax=Chironomus riparius TaxID=315576 RepID=A0A9N9RP28_9DIPT|nr:unnamed protein product [Chironomus riparius]